MCNPIAYGSQSYLDKFQSKSCHMHNAFTHCYLKICRLRRFGDAFLLSMSLNVTIKLFNYGRRWLWNCADPFAHRLTCSLSSQMTSLCLSKVLFYPPSFFCCTFGWCSTPKIHLMGHWQNISTKFNFSLHNRRGFSDKWRNNAIKKKHGLLMD